MKKTLFIAALTVALSCAAAPVRSVVTTTGNTRGETYFTGVNLGPKAYGDTFGGVQLPDEAALLRQLTEGLRAGGRVPASREHPATCSISIEWGTVSPGTGVDSNFQYISYEVLGADKTDLLDDEVRFGRVAPSRTATALIDMAAGDLYFVAITCSSKPADGSKPVVLWTSRAACTVQDTTAAEAIPFLISELRPHLGKDTGRPMIHSYAGTEWAQLTHRGAKNTALAMSPKD